MGVFFLLGAASVMVSACGSTSSGHNQTSTVQPSQLTPLQAVSSAGAASSRSKSTSVYIRTSIQSSGIPGGDVNETLTANGVVDFSSDQAFVTISGPGTTVSGTPLQILEIGNKTYVDGPYAGAAADTFVPAPTTSSSTTSLPFSVNPSDISSVLPKNVFAQLGALRNVTRLGTSVIAGITVTKYRATYKSFAQSPFAELMGQSNISATSLAGIGSPTEYIWLDSKGRVVQVATSTDLSSFLNSLLSSFSATTAVHPIKLVITLNEQFNNYGAKVHIPTL